MRPYLVVEGHTDQQIIQFLLRDEITVNLFNANGKYSAHSAASTLLITQQLPIVLLLDSDTQNENDIKIQYNLLNSLMYRASAPDTPYKILLAVPELEILLTFDKTVLEQLMGRTLSEAEWQLAQVTPRKFLYGDAQNKEIAPLLSKLNDEHITRIRQHPLMQELIAFLTEVSARVEE